MQSTSLQNRSVLCRSLTSSISGELKVPSTLTKAHLVRRGESRGIQRLPLTNPTKERWKPLAPASNYFARTYIFQDSGCHQRERQKSRHPAKNNKHFSNWKKR